MKKQALPFMENLLNSQLFDQVLRDRGGLV